MRKFRYGRPGSVLHPDSGKMVWFNLHHVDVFSGQEIRCWRRSSADPQWRGYVPVSFPNPWRKMRPGEEPAKEKLPRREALARQWLERLVGPEIRSALHGVPDELTWGALMIMTRVPNGLQLFRDHPVWCLWGYYHGYRYGTRRLGIPFSRLRQLVAKPRTRLLGEMGWLPEPRIARILDKVELHGLTPLVLGCCENLFREENPMLRHLQHLPRIPQEILQLCARQAALDHLGEPGGIQGPLLWDLAGKGLTRRREILKAHQESLSLKMQMIPMRDVLELHTGKAKSPFRIPEMASARRLLRWRNELRGMFDLVRMGLLQSDAQMKLPPAPVPGMQVCTPSGNVRIIPLSTVPAIFELAVRMRNCLARQVVKVMRGRSYFYQIDADFCGEHCCEIKWQEPDWRYGMCLGAGNRMPHPKVIEALRLWTEEMMVDTEGIVRFQDEGDGDEEDPEQAPAEDFPF